MQRIRLLAFLTGLGALLNAFGPRLIATEMESTPAVVGSEKGDAGSAGHVSDPEDLCPESPTLKGWSA